MILAIKIMKKLSIMLIILLLFSQFSINAVSDNEKNTIYVDDDNTQGPWDGTQDNPYQFIQDGVDASETGDTVYVYGGFYNEQVSIDKPLNLRGESIDDTIIDGTGLGRICAIEETTNVVVSGFTFQNAEKEIEALYLSDSSSVVVEQNRFIDNEGLPIFLGGSNNIVQENEIMNNTCRLHNIWVTSNQGIIRNNTIKNNKGNAITINAPDNKIMGNIIEDNAEYGISIRNILFVDYMVISDNIIQGNTVGIKAPSRTWWHTITNNTISVNTIAGIVLHAWGSTISHNTFEKNPIALKVLGSASNNISHNTFSSNIVGIKTIETNSNSYTENNFIKNMVHASFFNILPLSCYRVGTTEFDTWDNNYWDNWKIGLPKPIFGLYCVIIPFCLFDKNPASEPFDI